MVFMPVFIVSRLAYAKPYLFKKPSGCFLRCRLDMSIPNE